MSLSVAPIEDEFRTLSPKRKRNALVNRSVALSPAHRKLNRLLEQAQLQNSYLKQA